MQVDDAPDLRRAWTVLAIASASTFLFVLDAGFLSVAFPDIEATFETAERSTVAWVSIIYFVTGSPALLLGASFGDKWGRSRIFVVGLSLFAIGALATALAPNIELLIVARAVEGAGVGLLGAMSLALVLPEFPAERRGIAIGAWGGAGAVAAVAAPSGGAVIVETLGWRAAFALMAPLAGISAVAGHRLLPNVRVASRARLDIVGLVAAGTAIAAAAAYVSLGNAWGWASGSSLGLVGLIVVALALFGWAARRRPGAVLDVGLLSNRNWVAGAIGAGLQQFGFLAMFFSTPLILVNIWDWSILEAGLGMSLAMAMSAVFGPLGGRAADRYGDRLLIIVGAIINAAGLLWWRFALDLDPSGLRFAVGAVLVGIGGALCGSLTTSAALRNIGTDQMAVASAALSTLRRVCAGVGIAVAVVLLGEAEGTALLPGAQRVWLFAAVVTLAMILPVAQLREA